MYRVFSETSVERYKLDFKEAKAGRKYKIGCHKGEG